MEGLTSAIGQLVTNLSERTQSANVHHVSAAPPLDDLSSTGISYSTNTGHFDDDNLSVASQLTQAASALSQSLSDINPRSSSGNIAKRLDPLLYDLDKHSDITEVKAWYQNVISHMADEPKFSQLLVADKSDALPQPPAWTRNSNLSLRTQLWPKLSKPLQNTLQCTDSVIIGTDILLQIRSIFSQEGANVMNAEAAELELKTLKWNMTKASLGQFTNTFSSMLTTVKTGNLPFSAEKARSTWIQAMPSHTAFTGIKQALWDVNQDLPEAWLNASGPLGLSQVKLFVHQRLPSSLSKTSQRRMDS